MDLDRVEVVVSETYGPVARHRPRVVLTGRACAGASEPTPLVLGPLAVHRLLAALEDQAEHETALARAIVRDLAARLEERPSAEGIAALLGCTDLLRRQLEQMAGGAA